MRCSEVGLHGPVEVFDVAAYRLAGLFGVKRRVDKSAREAAVRELAEVIVPAEGGERRAFKSGAVGEEGVEQTFQYAALCADLHPESSDVL